MDLRLGNKTALVTGASSGIGAATACLLAEEGADVIIVHNRNIRGARHVAKTVQSCGRRAWLYRFDVSEPRSIAKKVASLKKSVPKIDILILCAGQNVFAPFKNIQPREWSRIVNINLNGAFYVLHAITPLMSDQSSVVIVSSVSAYTGSLNHAHYDAAKAGLIGLTKSAARALAPNIRVNCVAPGVTNTLMGHKTIEYLSNNYRKEKLLVKEFASAEEIAQLIVFVASPLARFITGATVDINGGRYLR